MKILFLSLRKPLILWAAFFIVSGIINTSAQERIENFSFSAYQALELPDLSANKKSATYRKIKIAIVDDAFNVNHKLIKPFLSKNSKEIPNNHFDDDENGYIDDNYGWNVSDNDNDISIAEGREREFYHGTMIASIISTVFTEVYDTLASDYLELILVKAVSNKESNTYIKEGYEGISYAIACKVDVICCAWSGGKLTASQKKILEEAHLKGITIIGSAGNHFNRVLDPAANKNVIAVSAVDSNMVLIPTSNCGSEIDFVARGDEVRAGHPLDNSAYFYGNGTSSSAALVTGVFGVVLSQFPRHTKKQILDALKYTSITVNAFNLNNMGKLGAGIPQAKKAIQYLNNPSQYTQDFNSLASEGTFIFYPKNSIQSYTVKPYNSLYGYEFQIDSEFGKKKKIILKISTKDSTYLLKGNSPLFYNKQIALGNSLTINNLTKRNRTPIRISYQPIIIDSSKLYCKDVKYLYAPNENLEDGSGVNNYANKCDCKWIIKAPPDKRIKLHVTNIDTQGNKDFLWVFEGNKTLNENLIAKFSGTNTPPIITSASNEILLWFLTDNTSTGKGWNLSYSWVD